MSYDLEAARLKAEALSARMVEMRSKRQGAVPGVCPYCGAEFAGDKTRIYCTRKCREAAGIERRRDRIT